MIVCYNFYANNLSLFRTLDTSMINLKLYYFCKKIIQNLTLPYCVRERHCDDFILLLFLFSFKNLFFCIFIYLNILYSCTISSDVMEINFTFLQDKSHFIWFKWETANENRICRVCEINFQNFVRKYLNSLIKILKKYEALYSRICIKKWKFSRFERKIKNILFAKFTLVMFWSQQVWYNSIKGLKSICKISEEKIAKRRV
jgi:hypothetical protein